MRTRLDCQDDLLEVRALYSIAALAQIANVSRDMLRRLLRSNGVTFLHAGRVLLVPLSEIRNKVPPLWKTLEAAELLRRGPCPKCGFVPPRADANRRVRASRAPASQG
jgi:hypothetical protein